MKKLLPIVIIIVLLILGGVGYYLYFQKSKSPTVAMNENNNVFSSIKDALSKSLSLQCLFTDDKNRKTTAYIKAGAVRADMVGSDPTQQYNSSSILVKDKKMYIWDTVKKQGMTMQLQDQGFAAPTGVMQQNQNGSPSENAGNVMATLEKYKNNCKPAVISDTLFTPPSDVTFQDLSKIMVPSTVMPSGMSQQNVQKMMQQYQQKIPQGNTGY